MSKSNAAFVAAQLNIADESAQLQAEAQLARMQDAEMAQAVATVAAVAARVYRPAASIFPGQKALQEMARSLGRPVMGMLIAGLNETGALRDDLIACLSGSPFQYTLALASDCRKGTKFAQELDYGYVAGKGGTLNEWLLQACKALAISGYYPAIELLETR